MVPGVVQDVDAAGRRYVVRNGHLPPRAIQTPLGDVQVQQPRVRDRRPTDERETFRSAILPPYLRKTPSLEALYPWLYLKGISTGDFGEALQALLGPEARGLSATTITRLKAVWEQEYQDWSKRSLGRTGPMPTSGPTAWVQRPARGHRQQTAMHSGAMGATRDGTKELIAITDGSGRGTVVARAAAGRPAPRAHDRSRAGHRGRRPRLLGRGAESVSADPGAGYAGWVHKTANVLNKLPTGVQPKAKAMLYDIWMAETQPAADRAFDLFLATFAAKFPAATTCLAKDRDVLLTFYAFPAEHWIHIRTTNPVESTFATVRPARRRRKARAAGWRA